MVGTFTPCFIPNICKAEVKGLAKKMINPSKVANCQKSFFDRKNDLVFIDLCPTAAAALLRFGKTFDLLACLLITSGA